jgi:hypothetical protein
MRGSEKTLALKPPTHEVVIPLDYLDYFDWSKEKRTLMVRFINLGKG